MKIEYFGKSDKGKVRKTNEDFFSSEKIEVGEYLFLVADGMGGHRAGDVASKLGSNNFVHHYKKLRKKKKSIAESMEQSLEKANELIMSKAQADSRKRGMGTTFSAIVIADMKAYCIHVGDSRIYLLRDSELFLLSRDHTFVGKMLEEGRITEEEARDHPQKNILYMSLGAQKKIEPEKRKKINVQEGDIFILCSDGLNNVVSDELIKEYALSYSAKLAVLELIKLANSNGGNDNITVQVIHIGKNKNDEKTEPIPILEEKKSVFSFFRKLFSNNESKNKTE